MKNKRLEIVTCRMAGGRGGAWARVPPPRGHGGRELEGGGDKVVASGLKMQQHGGLFCLFTTC